MIELVCPHPLGPLTRFERFECIWHRENRSFWAYHYGNRIHKYQDSICFCQFVVSNCPGKKVCYYFMLYVLLVLVSCYLLSSVPVYLPVCCYPVTVTVTCYIQYQYVVFTVVAVKNSELASYRLIFNV